MGEVHFDGAVYQAEHESIVRHGHASAFRPSPGINVGQRGEPEGGFGSRVLSRFFTGLPAIRFRCVGFGDDSIGVHNNYYLEDLSSTEVQLYGE